MILYVICAGANLWTQKGRVQGWRHLNLERSAKRQIKEMARALRDKGVEKVLCSDLHGETGFAIGRELRVPVMVEKSLRHFNPGHHSGRYRDEVEQIIEELAGRWTANPTIPIKGGDSWSSYTKRLGRAVRSLLHSPLQVAVLVLDMRGIQTLREGLSQGGQFEKADPRKSLLEKYSQVNPDKVLVVRLAPKSPPPEA